MIDIYFDIAFEEFYTRWVLRKMISLKESLTFFEGVTEDTTPNDFILFLNKMKEKQEYKDEFNTLYSKEHMKSFLIFLYAKFPEIKCNKVELLESSIIKDNVYLVNKYYELVWSLVFFQKVINEYFLDIEEYIKEMQIGVSSLLSEGSEKYNLSPISFSFENLKKIDFVVNGKYTNEELFTILFKKQDYSSFLPTFSSSLLLDATDFINLYNYPLKDYLLYLEFIKEMSYVVGKTHLSEYYTKNGSIKVREKYEKQQNLLLDILVKCKNKYMKDTDTFVFHKIPINYNETSDKYFGISYFIAESNIYGVGAVLLNRDSIYNPLICLFEDAENELDIKIRKKENQGLKEQILRNPKFFKEFLFMNKAKEGAASLEAVLNKDEYLKDTNWEKRSKRYEKEVEDLLQNILNEK